MGKLNIAIKDETEEQFRRAVADYMGLKKENISKAMEEAIYCGSNMYPTTINESTEKQRSAKRKVVVLDWNWLVKIIWPYHACRRGIDWNSYRCPLLKVIPVVRESPPVEYVFTFLKCASNTVTQYDKI
jgi:hypothetical protein